MATVATGRTPADLDGEGSDGGEVERLRAVAVDVAREVGELTVAVRASAVADVATKSSDTDVVTSGDTAAERLARELLACYRPGDPVLGEEEGGGEVAPGAVCWVVDPIDGTVNYLYGLPWWAVSVGAQRDGVTLAGAVVQPPSGRCWSAARGGGAECDGSPLRVTQVSALDQALVGTGFSYRAERRARQAALVTALLPRVRDIRRVGSAALDLCAVASGWLDGYVEHGLHRWDWAAGALVAAEAGAVLRLPGEAADGLAADGLGDAVLAAAPGIAADLVTLLRDCEAGQV
ncbi:MAG TPA: inositol monophosphatase family protein [Pseudonocardiaceae bacterium]|jgi:myo-inositol-1(or 4)-monophosphatase|nr:inositol monophosphatase family protein [Pseudonocardiaceae bacterium]